MTAAGEYHAFLARLALRARIRRDIIPAVLLMLAMTAAFLLGRCTR